VSWERGRLARCLPGALLSTPSQSPNALPSAGSGRAARAPRGR